MSEPEQKSIARNVGQDDSGELPIHIIKGAHFRVIHADGVWFGGSPFGGVHLTFYNERFPIPTKLVMRFDQNGQATEDESKRESRKGFVREMEVDIVLSPEAAITLYKLLELNLKAIEDTMKKQTQP